MKKYEEVRARIMRLSSPRSELLWRLNERAKGRNPGEPVNWPGLRGMGIFR